MTDLSLTEALTKRRSRRDFDESSIPLSTLKQMIWAAQGKTGEAGGKTVPSAHALYPLRLFVFAAFVDGLKPGFYAVDVEDGRLELLHNHDIRVDLQNASVDDQSWIGEAACIISVCGDFAAACRAFADQQPFGQRGTRYVYIEAGAATQNVLLQAASDNLGAVIVAGFEDEATSKILDLSSPLAPILHICIGQGKHTLD